MFSCSDLKQVGKIRDRWWSLNIKTNNNRMFTLFIFNRSRVFIAFTPSIDSFLQHREVKTQRLKLNVEKRKKIHMKLKNKHVFNREKASGSMLTAGQFKRGGCSVRCGWDWWLKLHRDGLKDIRIYSSSPKWKQRHLDRSSVLGFRNPTRQYYHTLHKDNSISC